MQAVAKEGTTWMDRMLLIITNPVGWMSLT
jgi:hypothetical protein